jgi:hypothetical protein
MFSYHLPHSNIWNNILKLFLKHPVFLSKILRYKHLNICERILKLLKRLEFTFENTLLVFQRGIQQTVNPWSLIRNIFKSCAYERSYFVARSTRLAVIRDGVPLDWRMANGCGNSNARRKLTPIPPEIPHTMAWHRTRLITLRSQWECSWDLEIRVYSDTLWVILIIKPLSCECKM